MPFAAAEKHAGVTKRLSQLSRGCGWTAWITCLYSTTTSHGNSSSWETRRVYGVVSVVPRPQGTSTLCCAQRNYATSSPYVAPPHHRNSSAAKIDADDWSTIEVEVLKPEAAPASSFTSSTSDVSATTGSATMTAREIGASPSSTRTEAVQTIDVVDAYAKAKVMNFIRRQQSPPPDSGDRGSAGKPSASSASSSFGAPVPGLEVREVQGVEGGAPQFHARWRLPLPPEYGERFGEGFAPTAKEAENVAAMHAERVIDALGFPLFLLSSKQRKHAEAARAAGRWATFPPASPSDTAATAAAELVPPPETPSPQPLQLLSISARERQERQLQINHVVFTPVEKGVFSPLSCTLASPYYYDPSSVRRIESFFNDHRVSFSRCLRLVHLQGGHENDIHQQQPRQRHWPPQRNLYLAQLTLPLPPQFGIRVAMGRGPTKKDAVTLACMHAELIIDAVGFALYPANHKQQAAHAEECARVRRWCAPPGDCDYRYTVTSPAPLELVDKLDASAAVAATAATAAAASVSAASPALINSERRKTRTDASDVRRHGHNGSRPEDESRPDDKDGRCANHGGRTDSADIEVGTTSSGSVESILLQHHNAVAAASHFANEVTMRDYENARLLLERYLEQFVRPAPPGAAPYSPPSPSEASPLRSLMFVETLGQRDRPCYRATITVPLVEGATAAKSVGQADTTVTTAAVPAASPVDAPLSYTQSFVAIGVSDVPHIAELAASLHALRTLAALNRLTLLRGSSAVIQAMESFATRGHLPQYKPTQPMLGLADVPPEKLPAAVRVMDGVIGRIAAAGLTTKMKEARAQVFTPGLVLPSRKSNLKMKSEHELHVLHRHTRGDFLLKELQQARSRTPRLDWDTTADAQNRIVIAPDTDPQTAPDYLHTLSSVRNPDRGVALRIRDYLERHGKTREMVCKTTRVPVSVKAPEEGYMFVTTLTLPLPEVNRWRTREEDDAAEGDTKEAEKETTAAEGAMVAAPSASTTTFPLSAAQISLSGRRTCMAQGEAPTREASFLMCNAHAELLLDALGIPLYDNSVLQCKHVDTARSLGRWAPLVRGALTVPAALRPLPPPLRKVTSSSALWARVQRDRHTAAEEASGEVGKNVDGAGAAAVGDSPAQEGPAAVDGSDATAGEVNDDDALCDVARLRFVHHTEIFHYSVRYASKFFTEKGLDFLRAVREYKVHHPKYGTVHRAIVELPTPPMYGKRYAVGVADSKQRALHLCSQHVVHILDALLIPLHHTKYAQSRYAHKGAVLGRKAPLPSEGRAGPNTPTPPGYYSVELSEAANERPPAIPVCPTADAAEDEFTWKTYVRRCAIYRQRWTAYMEKKAVSSLPVPGAPRSHVPVEDTTLDLAEAAPFQPQAGRQLREVCSFAGLPNPLAERIPFEVVKLSREKRVFVTTASLHGTPYTMRGFSSEGGPQSRQRAFMHGVQLVQRVVRKNNEICVKARWGWTEGIDRRVGMLDPLKGEITHHGRVWVLRMWSAMHCPQRALQVLVREESSKSNGAALRDSTCGAAADNDASTSNMKEALHTRAATPSSHAEHNESAPSSADGEGEAVELNRPQYYASVSVVEGSRAELPKVLLKESCVATGFNGAAAVQGAVHRVFLQLQRSPTMQALHRFLSHQPQLHLPSLRTLRDTDNIVRQLPLLLSPLVAEAGSSAAVDPPSLQSSSGESCWALPTYSTWPVKVLLRWVHAHDSAGELVPAAMNLPCTLAPLFASYGLVAADAALCRGSGEGRSELHTDSAGGAPSCLAGVLALLCRCLPQPFAVASTLSSASSSADPALAVSNAVARDRALPLQLAHVLLMGLLLDCVPWAVRLVAMVVCAEETLGWYTAARLALRLPEVDTQANPAATEMWSRMSVDVVEAVLLSADPATLPLPASVMSYARAVSQRLRCVSTDVQSGLKDAEANPENAYNTDVESRHRGIDAAWLHQAEALLRNMKDGHDSGSAPLQQLSMQETWRLRSLLRCAVVASVAPQEVWVRAGGAEDFVRNLYHDEAEEEEFKDGDGAGEAADRDDDDDEETAGRTPTSEELFVFQGRRSAPLAALCVNGMDLTRSDADSLHTLSSMAACFVAFGCAVEPVARREPAIHDATATPVSTGATLSAARSPSHCADSAAATEDEDEDDGNGDGSDAAETAEDDTFEKDEEEYGRDVRGKAIDAVCFTRVLGTCVTPLAAMVVGQDTIRSLSTSSPTSASTATTGGGALRPAGEDMPFLMTAFQGTVPLLVHDGKSVEALQQLSAHFRARVVRVSPFTDTERAALCQLVSLPVEAVRDDGVDDA
ncbi:putative mitochondrial hypothetical protein [Leptomonas pyrrhocoris]|uniref:REH2 DRSM domain-containing protein n=1 Tax=Leptomonas pyrrhocoris TaxID=157538 RepID=A0A0M9G1L1_LEPPY|nr:putative mitochondrial hypothetical protein [Leptomonas pyrrhocoris]KPA80540.1 putative mitochondrial hypothetical protein [Leptomonas pyrrhocoris]|eukprot:XP_015658979.1 putative mitochondrial hypothetical protein [Leptomonas pyrrhocoris]